MNKKWTIEKCKKIASERGGECLSDIYINYDTKLSWKCKYGHKWKTRMDNIVQDKWCPKCGRKVLRKTDLTVSKLKKIALEREGLFLSEVFINNKLPVKWQCKEGHQWKARTDNVLLGKWCPKCGNLEKGQYRKLNIEHCQEIAASRNGKCLSKKYKNCTTNLLWQCNKGHKWHQKLQVIKRGHWCPHCLNKNEQECRRIFGFLTGLKFIKCRPKWLRNPNTNRSLELDGYNKYYKIAFEYDGQQHYKPTYATDESKVFKTKKRDAIKDSLCVKHGVSLIRIPYWIKDKEDFIIKELSRVGFCLKEKKLILT
jgi:hypothetical protein